MSSQLNRELDTDEVISQIIGQSNSIRLVLEVVKNVAKTGATVPILGETGVGKEPVARAIHKLSSRSVKRFIRFNMSTLTAQLREGELFGHGKDGFAWSDRLRRGSLKLGHVGILFLD